MQAPPQEDSKRTERLLLKTVGPFTAPHLLCHIPEAKVLRDCLLNNIIPYDGYITSSISECQPNTGNFTIAKSI